MLFLLALLSVVQGRADGLPTISTAENEVWYLIQFKNGGNAITATTSGNQVTTGAATGTDAQLWKVTGNASDGYSFTNKKGLTLHAPSSAKEAMVFASATASGVQKFKIVNTNYADYLGAFEIQPVGNTAVSMNLFGGPSENQGVGFWNTDLNNPVYFTEASDFEVLGKISIVPYPSTLEVTKEGNFDISNLTAICYANEENKAEWEDFAAQLQKTSGISLAVRQAAATQENATIWMAVEETLPEEGYTLNVSDEGIVIKASTPTGFFYAMQTLKQLLPRAYFANDEQKDIAWNIPFVSINDQPMLEHRGYMLDVARHFFNKEEVKRILDIMALYKMNRFHWHLTDDQGWRIEIPEYPLLTEVGSIRSGSFTNLGEGQKFFDDTEYGRGMWYSKDDLKEVVAYAKARHIDIMPELDLPGHMVAAIAAYPEFSCDPTKTYSVRVDAGISKDVLNVGNDDVIDFLKCILDHLAEVFPFPYIHIGGDECPTDAWVNNPDCLRRVQEEGLTGVNQLQSWLVEELGTYLKEKHGKDIVVWDALLAHWNSDNKVKPVIMAWNSPAKAADAAAKGFRSIYSPNSQLYLDFMQVNVNKANVDEPYYGGWDDSNVNSLESVYNANPVGTLSGREEFCMGVQGTLWAETLYEFEEVQYQTLPRLLALSETGWLPAAKKDWTSFYRRLQQQDEILDALDYIYAKHYIEPAELTEAEKNLETAKEILNASYPGGKVGYPSAEAFNALKTAAEEAEANPENESKQTALASAINTYKQAAITQPEAGKYYQIVSASSYYKKQFEGSTMYQKDGIVRFHYTPQTEPEELWRFEAANGGYILVNACSGKQLKMPAVGSAVELVTSGGTTIRIDKATIATKNFDYIPGVVNISAVSGYNAAVTGSVKRLCAELSGQVYTRDEAKLCYPGTWTLVEVTDFTAQLQGLVNKCESTLRNARPGEINQPTTEAITFLSEQVLNPAKEALKSNVDKAVYDNYCTLYAEFLAMPRTLASDAISENHYYRIQNAYFTNYYAEANTSNGQVEPKALKTDSDAQLWNFVKGDNGTMRIFNKATGKAAYISSSSEEVTVFANYSGSGYADWTVEELTTDQNLTGLVFVEPTGVYSWYSNPGPFPTVLTKPKNWGGSIWNLVITETPTSIPATKNEREAISYYDLEGRRIQHPSYHGVYITSGGEKILR